MGGVLDCIKDPIRIANCLGQAFMFAIVGAMFILNAYHSCPTLLGSQEKCQGYINLGWFIIAQVLLNYCCFHYFSRRNRISIVLHGRKLKDQCEKFPEAGPTKYCDKCMETVPQVSHHCSLCNYCVMRNDHHCFIVNGCVGFGNQRYFIVFLFYGMLGILYAISWQIRYLNTYYSEVFPFGWMQYIAPVALFRWVIMQDTDMIVMGYCMLTTAVFGLCGGASVFFFSQMLFVAKGTTMHDFFKYRTKGKVLSPSTEPELANLPDISHIPDGINDRYRSVFGDFWALNFLFPQVWFPNELHYSYRDAILDNSTKEL